MTTKLTSRMDKILVAEAEHEAKHRRKSVSGMVADYFAALGEERLPAATLPPISASLFDVLEKALVSEEHYRQHLKDGYL